MIDLSDLEDVISSADPSIVFTFAQDISGVNVDKLRDFMGSYWASYDWNNGIEIDGFNCYIGRLLSMQIRKIY